MPRPAIAIALPAAEAAPVAAELREAGFEPITISRPDQLEAVLAERRDIAVAILDGETDFDESLEYYSVLHDQEETIASLMVVSQRTLERLNTSTAGADDEYLTRPYSAESMRWRIEAMCIRSLTIDDGSGPVLSAGALDPDLWGQRATVISIFNPKGGVGKTTIAMNLAAALQIRKGKQVLLVDADTVTGHVAVSLGLEQIQTVVDSWSDLMDGETPASFVDLASHHTSGMRIVALTATPLHTDALEPERVADAITSIRRGFDYVVVDLHPSYSALNRAIFDRSDKILVPVTPDVPALRAAVQLRDIAERAAHPRPAGDGREPRQQRRVGCRHGAHGRHAGHGPGPVGRSALRPRRERGPDGHRDVPAREDHRGLRRPRRPRARRAAGRTGAQGRRLRLFSRSKTPARV